MGDSQRIAVLDSVVQAQALEGVLTDRDIPHMIVSHYDHAYDGVFQLQDGWGHVQAPVEHRDEILTILAGLEQD